MSKEKTTEEIREEFLSQIWHLLNYWSELDLKEREKMEGLAFSILGILDGVSGGSPGFLVAPITDPSDKEFHISQGEDYYPLNDENAVKGDIAGGLHELFNRVGENLGYVK